MEAARPRVAPWPPCATPGQLGADAIWSNVQPWARAFGSASSLLDLQSLLPESIRAVRSQQQTYLCRIRLAASTSSEGVLCSCAGLQGQPWVCSCCDPIRKAGCSLGDAPRALCIPPSIAGGRLTPVIAPSDCHRRPRRGHSAYPTEIFS